jgi:hypothetical protein
MNGRWDAPTGGSWTAIFRVPYLKAVVLVGKGDCWNGAGGLLRWGATGSMTNFGWETMTPAF